MLFNFHHSQFKCLFDYHCQCGSVKDYLGYMNGNLYGNTSILIFISIVRRKKICHRICNVIAYKQFFMCRISCVNLPSLFLSEKKVVFDIRSLGWHFRILSSAHSSPSLQFIPSSLTRACVCHWKCRHMFSNYSHLKIGLSFPPTIHTNKCTWSYKLESYKTL